MNEIAEGRYYGSGRYASAEAGVVSLDVPSGQGEEVFELRFDLSPEMAAQIARDLLICAKEARKQRRKLLIRGEG